MAISFPGWLFSERLKSFSDTVNERKQGEMKRSMILVFVMIALLVVLLSPHATVAYYFDMIGTCAVSVYLMFSGVRSFAKAMRRAPHGES